MLKNKTDLRNVKIRHQAKKWRHCSLKNLSGSFEIFRDLSERLDLLEEKSHNPLLRLFFDLLKDSESRKIRPLHISEDQT